MILVVHDGPKALEEKLKEQLADRGAIEIISEDAPICHCLGCFGCWIKTPMECVIKDGYEDVPQRFFNADEFIVISRCCYGTYSPFVKNVFDRCISMLDPSFTMIDGEMHHKSRIHQTKTMSVYFYGATNDREESTARKFIDANLINLQAKLKTIKFLKSIDEVDLRED